MAIVQVTHNWDDAMGRCYDCGDPAAYCAPFRYGKNEKHDVRAEMLLCSSCAALAVAIEGEHIFYLWTEVDMGDPQLPEGILRFVESQHRKDAA